MYLAQLLTQFCASAQECHATEPLCMYMCHMLHRLVLVLFHTELPTIPHDPSQRSLLTASKAPRISSPARHKQVLRRRPACHRALRSAQAHFPAFTRLCPAAVGALLTADSIERIPCNKQMGSVSAKQLAAPARSCTWPHVGHATPASRPTNTVATSYLGTLPALAATPHTSWSLVTSC